MFSAALIAHIELFYDSDEEKNRLSQVVPIPNHATDWIPMNAAAMTNQFFWSQEPNIKEWLRSNRLDGFSRQLSEAPKDDEAKQAFEAAKDIDMRDYEDLGEGERMVVNVDTLYREFSGVGPRKSAVPCFAAMARFAGKARSMQ